MNKITPIKNGVDYKTLNLRAFDLILFKGSDFVSKSIQCLGEKALGEGAESVSHVGMIITNQVLRITNMQDNKLYIWESTMSGRLGGNVYNIEGKTFLGSQIRDFEEVLKSYDSNPDTTIAIRKLKNNPLDYININIIREKMAFLYGKYNNVQYEVNMTQLFSAMLPKCRCMRISRGEKKFLFCSELVAIVYKYFDIFPPRCNPSNVVPADFVVYDFDKDVDLNNFHNVVYITYKY